MGFDFSGRSHRVADNKTAAAFLYYRLQTASLTVSRAWEGGRGGVLCQMPSAGRGVHLALSLSLSWVITGNLLNVPQCRSVRITKVFFEVPLVLLTLLMSLLMLPMSSLVLPMFLLVLPMSVLSVGRSQGAKRWRNKNKPTILKDLL
jgi:hypothetical protein